MKIGDSKKNIRNFAIFISIILPILLVLMWVLSLENRVLYTIGSIIAIVFSWIGYYSQQKTDVSQENSLVQKSLSTGYKAEGAYKKFYSIGLFLVFLISIVGGIYTLIWGEMEFRYKIIIVGGVFFMGIAALIAGIYYWKRADTLLSGRFYSKE